MHEQQDNCLSIEGRVTKILESRQSPAGIPITRFLLEHVSRRQEADQPRDVKCRIGVVVAGEQLHRSMPGLQKDMQLRIRGFISQAGYRSGEYQLLLHAEQIEHIE